MRNLTFMTYLVCTLFIAACAQKQTVKDNNNIKSNSSAEGKNQNTFSLLRAYMNGNFSSVEQSRRDSDYFDIRLRMVPIWQHTDNIFYLYVEQAVSSSIDKPYRQRVYKVVRNNDLQYTSFIYLIPGPERFIGKIGSDPIFEKITSDSLIIKEGCEVRLEFDPSTQEFNGKTGSNTCPSDRSGAAWATSIVNISHNRMVSWDQGWNTEGTQVWGATKGGYIFMKEK